MCMQTRTCKIQNVHTHIKQLLSSMAKKTEKIKKGPKGDNFFKAQCETKILKEKIISTKR